MPKLNVVDLSHWNTVKSFPQMKAGGIVGVIHKVTEGTGFLDKTYAKRELDARAAGLGWAAYHFLKPGNIEAQMRWFIQNVSPVPAGMQLVIDYEDPKCTLDELRAAVKSIRAQVKNAQVVIYGGSLLKEQLGNTKDDLLGSCALWLAQYTAGTPTWPKATWPVWTLWQYSDGSVGGTPRDVPGTVPPIDCNQFNGSDEACARWFGLAVEPNPQPGPEPQPEPEPGPAPGVAVNMTVPDGVTVEIVVNGSPVFPNR